MRETLGIESNHSASYFAASSVFSLSYVLMIRHPVNVDPNCEVLKNSLDQLRYMKHDRAVNVFLKFLNSCLTIRKDLYLLDLWLALSSNLNKN